MEIERIAFGTALHFETQFQESVPPTVMTGSHPVATQKARLKPARPEQPMACPRLSRKPAAPQLTPAATGRRKALTPAKIDIAWDKVRRVVRGLCRQRGRECRGCRFYRNGIEFQLSTEHRPVVLDLAGDRISARIAGRLEIVSIVPIKTGGSGYRLRKKTLSSTRLIVELLREARIFADCREQGRAALES